MWACVDGRFIRGVSRQALPATSKPIPKSTVVQSENNRCFEPLQLINAKQFLRLFFYCTYTYRVLSTCDRPNAKPRSMRGIGAMKFKFAPYLGQNGRHLAKSYRRGSPPPAYDSAGERQL